MEKVEGSASPTEKKEVRDIRSVRAHHGLCALFFGGKGYDRTFTRHMQRILEELGQDPLVELKTGADEICSRCPHLGKGEGSGRCSEYERVEQYDRAVLEACGLQAGERLRWSAFERLVKERILAGGLRRQICGGCQWNEICGEKDSEKSY